MYKVDLKNKIFNKLQVIELVERKSNRQYYWKCRCDCGNIIVVRAGALKNSHSKSCGCLNSVLNNPNKISHGMSRTRIYRAWSNMKVRCYKKRFIGYKDYGGRGIRVCDRWKDSFENFWEDMNVSYRDNLTLDRIDNDKGYSKENCKWATTKEQNNNKRKYKKHAIKTK